MKFSAEVLSKAHRLLATDHIKPDSEHANIWWVMNLAGEKLYRVQTDVDRDTRRLHWITCTCAHGLNSGAGDARCYHIAAVLITLRDQLDAEVEA